MAIATPVVDPLRHSQRAAWKRACTCSSRSRWQPTVREAEALVDLAEPPRPGPDGRPYVPVHNAVRRIKEIVEAGELGRPLLRGQHPDQPGSVPARHQRDLGPRPPRPLDRRLRARAARPRSISAWGCCPRRRDIEDIAYVNVDYGDQMLANFHVNWLSPVKIRQMIFAGSRKSLVFNELNATEPIKVYDRGIELGESAEDRRSSWSATARATSGAPTSSRARPCRASSTHFAECIRDGKTPLSDGQLGLRVVRLLEAATRSIRPRAAAIVLSNGAYANGTRRPTSECDPSRTGDPDRPGRPAGQKRDHALLR